MMRRAVSLHHLKIEMCVRVYVTLMAAAIFVLCAVIE